MASFPHEASSVSEARRFVREELSCFSTETVEAAELMVSELASNCIRHADSGFEVAVRAGKEIRVEVTDAGDGVPRRLSPRPTDPSGRGLMIVEGLSRRWGVSRRRPGKTVWFTLAPRSASERDVAARDGGDRARVSRLATLPVALLDAWRRLRMAGAVAPL
jgi:anti-sigma regulatory factor (Ser/Thr protein kinase)